MNTPSKPPVALDNDEYGNACTGQAATRYGWLGGKQRSTETLTGLSLMGVRLYNPVSGRFLSADPIYGGNERIRLRSHGSPQPVRTGRSHLHVGWRGVTRARTRNGKARWHNKGNNHWRSAAWKLKQGGCVSNLERYQKGHQKWRNLHIQHRKPRRWAPWW